MSTNKIESGSIFPSIAVQDLDDNTDDIGSIKGDAQWKMVVVYRGQHCPLCTKYLNKLESYVERLTGIGVEVVAVSGDSKEQLESYLDQLNVSIPIYYGLTLEQMHELGLYVSIPRSEKETDHPFPEPGLFVINADHRVQVVDISNNPFTRPEFEALISGLEWIKNPDNNYPIRGTYKMAQGSARSV